MRILAITNLYPPDIRGGYEILCGQVCERLAARGLEVHVLTTGSEAPRQQADVTVRSGLRLLAGFDEPAQLRRIDCRPVAAHNENLARSVCAELEPDVVFVWSQLRLTLGAARGAERSGVPVLYSLNDEHLAGYAARGAAPSVGGAARYAADRTVFRDETTLGLQFEQAICISDLLRRRLEAQGVVARRTTVLHQGIPLENFPPKRAGGSLNSPMRLLYVGQLHPYKGVHDFIEALPYLARNPGGRYVATVVGRGAPAYERELISAAGRGPVRVDFRGQLDAADLAAIYREHDALVFPSVWAEPFGLTHLEAMASGTPVVSTATGGQAELLRDNDNALVVETSAPQQIAAAIERLRTEDALRRRIVASALRDVRERHSLDTYVQQIESVLRGRAA